MDDSHCTLAENKQEWRYSADLKEEHDLSTTT